MGVPVFAFLRWVQKNPKMMRAFDLALGMISIVIGLRQNSALWLAIGVICVLAAIFRLGERMNLFLPKLNAPKQDHDA